MSMVEMNELLEASIQRTYDEMKKMEVGSEQYSRASKDFAELFRRRIEVESNENNYIDQTERRRIQEEMNNVTTLDMYEKREEQKRKNEEELRIKADHNKTDWMKFWADVGIQTLKMTMYGTLTHRAFEGNKNGWMLPSPRDTKYIDPIMR